MERQLEAVGEGLPNRAQAEEIMQRSLKVLYYRDKSTYNNWSIGFAEKVSVENVVLKTWIVIAVLVNAHRSQNGKRILE